jgi:hypothetical protein
MLRLLAAFGAVVALLAPACARATEPQALIGDRATFARADVDRLIDQILIPWPSRQNRNGTFPDLYNGNDARGRSRGYDEAMMGAVLLRWGTRTQASTLTRSGLAALERHLDPAHYKTPSVFEAYAMSMAYLDARRSGLLRAHPRLASQWRRWLADYRPVYMSPSRPFSNQRMIEAAAYRQLLATGIRSRRAGAVLASRNTAARDLADFDAALARTAANDRRGGVAAFSDPPRNPLAYVPLTAAFLGRYATTASDGGARARFLELARGLLAITGPDGDVAYAGRSQAESWALSFGAYAALRASHWEPARRQQFRSLAARYLQRLAAVHMPRGELWITPLFAATRPGLRTSAGNGALAGVDSYTGAVVYQSLTALGLQWTRELLDGEIKSSPAAPVGAHVVSTGPSQMVILRRANVWAAVRPRPSWRAGKVDLRADAGLLRLKIRAGRAWTDLLPLPPRTHGTVTDSLAPRLLAGSRPVIGLGTVTSVTPSRVVMHVRYGSAGSATLSVRLTERGAVVTLAGAPRARYRVGVMGAIETRTTSHRFQPAPVAVRVRAPMYSAETSLRRVDVDARASMTGHLRWSITTG